MENKQEALFSIQNLKKSFPNGFEALSGINLDIHKEVTTLIAGANGSGKTVLMKILSGLLEASEGAVYYKGKHLNSYKNLNSLVGLVFQEADSQILGETVEEDIAFGPENLKLTKDEIEERVLETLSSLNLNEKKDFPARLLSGGEKRRLAVAGVLAMGCETIIMDEPFANLDWPGVVQVKKIINELREKKINIIILSHDLEKIIDQIDHIIILNKGKLMANGSKEDVVKILAPDWGVKNIQL